MAFGLRGFNRVTRRFRTGNKGSMSITVALSILPMLIAMGTAVDMLRLLSVKAKFDSYADSAAVMGASQVGGAVTAATAKANAEKAFLSMGKDDSIATGVTGTATVTDSQGIRNVTFDYSITVPMSFMNLLNISTMPVAGKATAIGGTPQYSDFYVLVDNSPSMGFAATTADATKLGNLTKNGYFGTCQFACHDLSQKSTSDYYMIAKNNNVVLRIDSVRNAINSMFTLAQGSTSSLAYWRFATYDFGPTAQTHALTTIAPLNSNISTVISQTSTIDLMTSLKFGDNNDNDSDMAKILASFTTAVGTSGSGQTQATSRKFAFFLSDGANNAPSGIGAINAANCSALKANGVTVVVIYTTYLPVSGTIADNFYNSNIKPSNAGPYSPSTNSVIAQNMKACASPGYYEEVGPNDSIDAILQSMFLKLIGTPRLTS